MAQNRLSQYVAAPALLAAGAAVEVAADQSLGAGLADWAVGAALVLAGRARRRSPVDLVALLAAALWFLATLALTPDGWWHLLDGPLALAYRGPVLHLLAGPVATARGRVRWPTLAAAYGLPLVVSTTTGLLTAGVAVALALLVTLKRRPEAVVLAMLAVVWAGTALGPLGPSIGNGALLLAAGAIAVRHRTGGDRAMAGMVVELSQDDRPATPLSAALAEALGDPDLRIVVFAEGHGWRDDAGRPTAPPDLDAHAGRVTLIPLAGGGSLALVHGPGAITDPDLSAAAARAAVLVLERVRVGTQIRLTAEEIRRSGARLLAVDDQERHNLAARLDTGPRRRLARVRALLEYGDFPSALLDRLNMVDGELDRLARGLLPYAVANRPLSHALRALLDDGPLPVNFTFEGPVDDLPEQTRALVYFMTAECLTNAARHSGAREVDVVVRVGHLLRVEVRDSGRGGADLAAGHGLQGLADRVTLAGGIFTVGSPTGGPTNVTAEIPLKT